MNKKAVCNLLCLCLMVSAPLFSQVNSYFTFPDSAAQWTETFATQSGTIRNQYAIFGDTIINSIQYHKVYHKNYGQYAWDTLISAGNSALIAAIREDSAKRIYCIPFSSNYFICDNNNSEYRIYDFSKQTPGDTIEFYTNYPDCFAYPVLTLDFIDSAYVNNSYRKQFHFLEQNETWIEGVGSLRGLFSSINPYLTCACQFDLICFKQNDTVRYINPLQNGCYPPLTNSVDFTEAGIKAAQISPQPLTDYSSITFSDKEKEYSVTICNAIGQTIKQYNTVSGSGMVISRGNLERGLYLAHIKTQGKTVAVLRLLVSH